MVYFFTWLLKKTQNVAMCRKLLVPVNYIYICCIWIDRIQAKYVMVGSSLLLLFWESSSRLKFWTNVILNQTRERAVDELKTSAAPETPLKITYYLTCLVFPSSFKDVFRLLIGVEKKGRRSCTEMEKNIYNPFHSGFHLWKMKNVVRSFFAVAVPIVSWLPVVK